MCILTFPYQGQHTLLSNPVQRILCAILNVLILFTYIKVSTKTVAPTVEKWLIVLTRFCYVIKSGYVSLNMFFSKLRIIWTLNVTYTWKLKSPKIVKFTYDNSHTHTIIDFEYKPCVTLIGQLLKSLCFSK